MTKLGWIIAITLFSLTTLSLGGCTNTKTTSSIMKHVDGISGATKKK